MCERRQIELNYFISDLHFGCQNKFEGRTLEHDQIIIHNWNNIVTNSDTVYILGDIGKIGGNKDNEYLCKCISVLKGRKVCVLGNHDKELKDLRLRQLFTEICDRKEITDNYNGINQKLVLLHSPEVFWNGQHKGAILLYGHLHISDEWEMYKKLLNDINDFFKVKTLNGAIDCPPVKAYNVGAPLPYINYTPRTLKEIIAANEIIDNQ